MLQAEHERQQYGLYGHLLLQSVAAERGGVLRAAHPNLPDALLTLGPKGCPSAPIMSCRAQSSRSPSASRFGTTENGVRWFRDMTIAQGGKPYFALTIETLTVELTKPLVKNGNLRLPRGAERP